MKSKNWFRCMVCDKKNKDSSKSGKMVKVEKKGIDQSWMTCRKKFCKQLAKDGMVMWK